MNPQNQKPLALDARQQELFDRHTHLVRIAVGRYRKFCPPAYWPDLEQEAHIALVKAARNFRKNDRGDFGALAWLRIRDAARAFCIGRRRFGLAALKNAEARERSSDDVVGFHDGDTVSRGTLAENDCGRAELQGDVASDNLAGRLFDVRLALHTAPMSAFERRVLRLRFDEGLELGPIAAKLSCSVIRVKRTLRVGVQKLRVHLSSQGHKTLPPGAPLPWSRYPSLPRRRGPR